MLALPSETEKQEESSETLLPSCSSNSKSR